MPRATADAAVQSVNAKASLSSLHSWFIRSAPTSHDFVFRFSEAFSARSLSRAPTVRTNLCSEPGEEGHVISGE
jgi:hypothetical protein